VAGFAVSRGLAEAQLAERPAGAFLVRLCSEPGAFAVSCHVGGAPGGGGGGGAGAGGAGGGPPGAPPPGGYVDHLLVDAVDLQARPLEAWVLAHAAATHLLDVPAGRLLPKVRRRARAIRVSRRFAPIAGCGGRARGGGGTAFDRGRICGGGAAAAGRPVRASPRAGLVDRALPLS